MKAFLRAHHWPLRWLSVFAALFFCWGLMLCNALPAQAQTSRFTLRAEPDVIPANGISTASIFVQVPQDRGMISESPLVRFATTAGVIESQAQLSGGVARVLLRSATAAGTAVVTAFIGNSREAITVEFSADNGIAQRYLEVSAPYVAYGAQNSVITSSGKSTFDFGDTHIESDVRLDVDLSTERVWAQGTKGHVILRYGRGEKAKQLSGDRLFYDMRRRRGVMRRAEAAGADLGARQEFMGSDFAPPPTDSAATNEPPSPAAPAAASPAQRPNPESPDVKPALSPSPLLPLENEADRGSTFIQKTAPTGPENAENGTAPAIAAPAAVGEAREQTKAVEQDQATTNQDKPNQNTPNQDAKANADKANEDKPKSLAEVATDAAKNTQDIVPGSLADTPRAPQSQESRVTSLVTVPRPAPTDDTPSTPPVIAPYKALPADAGVTPRIVELPPPDLDVSRGYWVASRRLRVFPRDKVQFEHASIYFNGKKAFGWPLYVLPLDGSFNPTTDMVAFNSEGGATINVPFYYQASKSATGAVYLKREPGSGFSTQQGGFSLALDHQYWLSPRSHGDFSLDQLGRGDWNLNYEHQVQFSPNTTGSFFFNMPRHQDMFARASLSKELKAMQIGFEGFYDKPEGLQDNVRGQFYARLRPKAVGKSGWNYSLSANALAVRRYSTTTLITTSSGGGVVVPGQGSGGGVTSLTRTRPLMGQTLTASLQSPTYSPWRGADFSANLLATAFNYSDGRRGVAPGVTMGLGQKLGRVDMRLDYTYDRSNLGLYGLSGDSFTHYLSASVAAQLTSKVGVSSFLSRSMNDGSLYGNADLDYFISQKWRVGLFTDYSNFTTADSLLNYGWSIGRSIGAREISVNYDAIRGRVYFELGNARY